MRIWSGLGKNAENESEFAPQQTAENVEQILKLQSDDVKGTVFRRRLSELWFRHFFHSLDFSFGSFLCIKAKKRSCFC